MTQQTAAEIHLQLQKAAQAGISLRGLAILYGLAALPEGQQVAATEVCLLAGLNPDSSITHAVGQLAPAERAGLVRIHLRTGQRRNTHLYSLTPAGRDWLTPARLKTALHPTHPTPRR